MVMKLFDLYYDEFYTRVPSTLVYYEFQDEFFEKVVKISNIIQIESLIIGISMKEKIHYY